MEAKKYYERPDEYRAVKFDKVENALEIGQWLRQNRFNAVQFVNPIHDALDMAHLVFEGHQLYVGNWIVIHPDGSSEVLSETKFNERFVSASADRNSTEHVISIYQNFENVPINTLRRMMGQPPLAEPEPHSAESYENFSEDELVAVNEDTEITTGEDPWAGTERSQAARERQAAIDIERMQHEDVKIDEKPARGPLDEELGRLMNYYSLESESGTPDFILAKYLIGCLNVFNETVAHRASWRGEKTELPALAEMKAEPAVALSSLREAIDTLTVRQPYTNVRTVAPGVTTDQVIEIVTKQAPPINQISVDDPMDVGARIAGIWYPRYFVDSSSRLYVGLPNGSVTHTDRIPRGHIAYSISDEDLVRSYRS